MAAFDHVENMYDVSLKPRLLRSLVKEHLPDEKQPFRNPLDLSHVVSTVKTHRLLSEATVVVEESPIDRKLIENWKSAVDAWVNRLMMLVSTDMPDKCWAGICLLGVTCQECGSERFLASYSLWFHKLLSHIQPPAESHFVKVASCASMSDLFTRLGGFPNIKKDGTSHAAKLVQPVLKMLNDDSPDSVWEGAVCLLCTLITSFPSSVNRHYDSAEAAIVSRIMSGKCSGNMLQKLCHCLALLPKSKGDGDSWSLLMQKILFSINIHLTDAFQGVEEEFRSNEAMRILVPPGKDPPPPLGGQTVLEPSDQAKKRSERLLMSTASALMICCCTMLTCPYPVQTTVPVRPILMLTGRVLMIDGSLAKALYPFMTAMQQESICSELPILHMYSLELLAAIVKGVRSQLLPHSADIVRLLTEYFRRCTLPELRIKVYSIIKILLTSMGVGMALYLSEEVIKNAFDDLDSVDFDKFSNAYSKVSSETVVHASHRKRKHADSLEEQPGRVGLEAALTKTLAPISVKIAALQALEALLTVGGASRSESWRADVDLLIITVATNACKSGFSKEGKSVFLPGETLPTWADFQLAALRALLASIISPARVRPPYLAHGLELFHRGMKETGTEVAEFCAHAHLALEVLIHPRSLPVIDLTSTTDNPFDALNRRFPESLYSSRQTLDTSFSGGPPAKGPTDPDSDEDNLYETWLANGDESETLLTEKPSLTFSEADKSSAEKVREESERIRRSVNEVIMIDDTDRVEETIKKSEETVLRESGAIAPAVVALDPMDGDILPGKADMADDAATKGDGFVGAASNSEVSKRFRFELEDDSSVESIPDIVDGDPDSD